MDLNSLWFLLLTVLFMGFFLLEGFDYGVGILVPMITRSDHDRRLLLNTIGPFWDANEVWLITAGGAMFAAFPDWYATLFSGFYIPLMLMLLALILRGVAFEFRSKADSRAWRIVWDSAFVFGSAVPALLWGIALVNLLIGVPIDAEMTYVGGFWNLLSPAAILSGLTGFLLFCLHGAAFLSLRLEGDLLARVQLVSRRLWIPTAACAGLALFWVSESTQHGGTAALILAAIGLLSILTAGFYSLRGRAGWTFLFTSAAIVVLTAALFAALYPNVMISSLDAAWNLTIYNASSSAYTLKVMSIVALMILPLVLIYQGWSYYIFRRRLGAQTPLEY
ncbi:MAG: cytochrome d ubiquinol oxidase subunit II [Anaerolineales bacterium]|nr:cytochrome d ubiquinol oxidase subunit II [Anaerolineales bacterium]